MLRAPKLDITKLMEVRLPGRLSVCRSRVWGTDGLLHTVPLSRRYTKQRIQLCGRQTRRCLFSVCKALLLGWQLFAVGIASSQGALHHYLFWTAPCPILDCNTPYLGLQHALSWTAPPPRLHASAGARRLHGGGGRAGGAACRGDSGQ